MDWNKVRDSPRKPTGAPPLELVAVLFRVRGATQRPLRCALYQAATGLELRLEYEDRTDDVQRSHLFRVRDDDAIATMADEWHAALIAKGFTELEIVRQPDGRQGA
jgi:hypothetical protein